jgi:Flp pilus assembly protein TadG
MKQLLTTVALLLLVAGTAAANHLVSQDTCDPECDTHSMEWRELESQPWAAVAGPTAVGDVTDPRDQSTIRGVAWTTQPDFGFYRAFATRDATRSLYSNLVKLGTMPTAPLLISVKVTVEVEIQP